MKSYRWTVGRVAIAWALLFQIVSTVQGQSNEALGLDASYFTIAGVGKKPNPNSVKSIKDYLRRLQLRVRQGYALKQFGIEPKGLKAIQKAYDWWGAHLEFIEIRAWPKDEIDWSIWKRAVMARRTMKSSRPPFDPTNIKGGLESNQDYPNGSWVFLGPRNPDSPGAGAGPSPVSGRIGGIAISYQNPSTVWYVAGANGGLFKTIDGGTTWTPLSDDWDTLHIGAVAVDPTNEDIVYAGTGDYDDLQRFSNGIMKSTNGGSTWSVRGNSNFGDSMVSDIVVDPDDHNVIYVSTGRGDSAQSGVWRSANGGSTWTQELFGDYDDLSFSTRVGGIRYIWAARPGFSVNRSSDGVNWSSILVQGFTSNETQAIACSKVDQETVYVLATTEHKIYKTTNNGDDWTNVTNNFTHGLPSEPPNNWRQNTYDWYIETSKTSTNADVVLVGLVDLNVSRNGGATWFNVGQAYTTNGIVTLHVDHHVAVPHPTANDTFFCGSDGGFYKVAYSGGWSVTNYNASLPIMMFYSLQAHSSDATQLMGGAQDNGVPHSRGDLNNWSSVGGGDGTGTGISVTDPNFQYCTNQRYGLNNPTETGDTLDIKRTNNAWTTFGSASFTVTAGENVSFAPPIALSADTLPKAYMATDYLYRLTELGSGAYSKTNHLGGVHFATRVTAISVAPSNGNYIYVGTVDGNIYRTSDGGTNWALLPNTVPDMPITSFCIHPTTPTSVLVTISGENQTGNVWRCLNTSASPLVWDNRSNGLPAIWTNWIERDPWSPSLVWYCANDFGVFYTDDAGLNWYDMTSAYGLPPVGVRRLQAMESTGRLYAGSYGRGAYRMLINNTRPQLVEVAYSTTTVVGGTSAILQLTFDKITPPDGLDVTIAHSPSSLGVTPTSYHVPGGRTTANIAVLPPVVANDTTLVSTATGQYGGQLGAIITILSHELTGLTLNPTTVLGSHNSTGTVFLNHDAPSGGIVVSLSSLNTAAATVPSTVTVPNGSQIAQFTVASKSVNATSTTDIRASFSGTTQLETLTVTPINLNGHTITQSSITGGDNFNGTVAIAFAAGPQGVPINLSSNNPNAQVPATVTVPNGQTTATYNGTSSLVSPSTVNVTITANKGTSFYTDAIALQPVQVSSITFLKNPVVPGRPTTMFVNLSRPIPASGLSVSLSSDSPQWLSMPATATYFLGQTTIPVTITPKSFGPGSAPAKITITASHMSSSKKAKLVILGR